MKKVFLLSVLTLSIAASAVTAQTKKPAPMPQKKLSMEKHEMMSMDGPTQKGKWLVGANLGIGSYKNDVAGVNASKNSTMVFQPAVSYFIKDDLAVGLVLGIGSQKTQLAGVDDHKASALSIAPSVRYYMPIGNRVKFFGQLLVPIGSEKTTLDQGAAVDVKTQTMGVNLIPGFAFFPSSKISIELNVGSIYFQTSKAGDDKNTSTGISMLGQDLFSGTDNFAFYNPVTIGIKFHLGK
jgi:outer membrane protein